MKSKTKNKKNSSVKTNQTQVANNTTTPQFTYATAQTDLLSLFTAAKPVQENKRTAITVKERAQDILLIVSTIEAGKNNSQYTPILEEIAKNNKDSRIGLFAFITKDLVEWAKDAISNDVKKLQSYASYINAAYFAFTCTAKHQELHEFYIHNYEILIYFVEGYLTIAEQLLPLKEKGLSEQALKKKVPHYVSLIPLDEKNIKELLGICKHDAPSLENYNHIISPTEQRNKHCARLMNIRKSASRILYSLGDISQAKAQIAPLDDVLSLFRDNLSKENYASQQYGLKQAKNLIADYESLMPVNTNTEKNNNNSMSGMMDNPDLLDNVMLERVRESSKLIMGMLQSQADEMLTRAALLEAIEDNPKYDELRKTFQFDKASEKSLTALCVVIEKSLSNWAQEPAQLTVKQLGLYAGYANAAFCMFNLFAKYPGMHKFHLHYFEVFIYFVQKYMKLAEELFNNNGIKINDNHRVYSKARNYATLIQKYNIIYDDFLDSIKEDSNTVDSLSQKITPQVFRDQQCTRIINLQSLYVQILCHVGECDNAKEHLALIKQHLALFATKATDETLKVIYFSFMFSEQFINLKVQQFEKKPYDSNFLQLLLKSRDEVLANFKLFSDQYLTEKECIDINVLNDLKNKFEKMQKRLGGSRSRFGDAEFQELIDQSLALFKALKPMAGNKNKNKELLESVGRLLNKWKDRITVNDPNIIQKCIIEYFNASIEECTNAITNCVAIIPISTNLNTNERKTEEHPESKVAELPKSNKSKSKTSEQIAAEKKKALEQAELKKAMRLIAKANKAAAHNERMQDIQTLQNIERHAQETQRLEREKQEELFKAFEKLQLEDQEKEYLDKERFNREKNTQAKLERERRIQEGRHEKQRLEKEALEKEALEKERMEKEQLDKETANQTRLEKEQLERELLENKKLEAELIETQRLATEQLEKENLEKQVQAKQSVALENNNVPRTTKHYGHKKRLQEYVLKPKKVEAKLLENKKKEIIQVALDKELKVIINILSAKNFQVAIKGEYLLSCLLKKFNPDEDFKVKLVEIVTTCPKETLQELFKDLRYHLIQDAINPHRYSITNMNFLFDIQITYSDPLRFNDSAPFYFETLYCTNEQGDIEDPLDIVIDNLRNRNGSLLFSDLGTTELDALFQKHPEKMLYGLKISQKFNIPLPETYKKAMQRHATLISQLDFWTFLHSITALLNEGNAKSNLDYLQENDLLIPLFPFLSKENIGGYLVQWKLIFSHIDSLAPSLRKKFPPIEVFSLLCRIVPHDLNTCFSLYPQFQSINLEKLIEDMRYFHETHDKYGNCTNTHALDFVNGKNHVCMHASTFTIMYGNHIQQAATQYIHRQPKSKTQKVVEKISKKFSDMKI